MFSARLRLDSSLADSDETIRLFADNILQDVELTELADALIGSEDTQGLSFEQRKRLSIAVELAASPSIIFLDEVRIVPSVGSTPTVPFLTYVDFSAGN